MILNINKKLNSLLTFVSLHTSYQTFTHTMKYGIPYEICRNKRIIRHI